MLPYKRFAAPCLLARAAQYLHEPRATYRSVVRHDRCLIGYPPRAQGAQDANPQEAPHTHQPVVPPSLAWRFISWLGSLTFCLDKAREMILAHHPNSLCHRESGSVDPFKARSEDRQRTLETARQLLLVMPEWEECFGRKFFPQFATRAGFD